MKNIPTAWCCHHHASLLWGCCSRGDERCWVCARHSVFNFSLIWPEYHLSYVWGVSHMPFGEHQTCLLIFFLVCEFWWAALSWQVCCGAILFPFFNNGFDGASWDVQSFWYFFYNPTWSVLLHSLFRELPGLHGAPCLVVLQTLGPFRTGVCILRSCDTDGLYLTNDVTSEGNWLHQILFRGFTAKGGWINAPLFHLFILEEKM